MECPIIYNLFPRLVGPMSRWLDHTLRAKHMGFNWIYVNPVQYPGFSGSLYAVKDYYRLNPLFVDPGTDDPMGALRQTIQALHDQGLRVMMDLVINHTAKDSLLVKEHPSWYLWDANGELVSPSAIDPADANNVTIWGDLAEINYEGVEDKKSLWSYWEEMVRFYIDLGFDGFRCDAAYKVPADLWEFLISAALKVNPQVQFFAETLGCQLSEVRQLKSAGFHYLFNSSKWWNYDSPWCLEQHEEFGRIAPSIAFPESHDTPRLMKESGGLAQVQKQRYAFATVFSAGLLMPIGFEYGFRKEVNVVHTMPDDWENPSFDLSPFIRKLNHLKTGVETLGIEGHWEVITELDRPTIVLRKSGEENHPQVLVVINKDWNNPQTYRLPEHEHPLVPNPARVLRVFGELPPTQFKPPYSLFLEPAEIVLILPERGKLNR